MRTSRRDMSVEINVKIKYMTDKAILVNFGAPDPVWVPKSQITDWAGSDELDHNVDTIFIPEWLAIEKGMV